MAKNGGGGGRGQITTTFDALTGVLTVSGDEHDNAIAVAYTDDSKILVNGNTVSVATGDLTVAMTSRVELFGKGGDDELAFEFVGSYDAIPAAIAEGGAGSDVAAFVGADAEEFYDLSSTSTGVRFTRNIGSVVVDANGMEQVRVTPRGSVDRVTLHDLAGSTVSTVALDLATGSGGDNFVDSLTIEGSVGNDTVVITETGKKIGLTGLAAAIEITGAEPTDVLRMAMLHGNDFLNASALTGMRLILFGGPGDDTITGTNGDDFAYWYPGDGSDVMDLKLGSDRLFFQGANVGEAFDLSAYGSGLRVTRSVGNVVLDAAGVEMVELMAAGGPDLITVKDLTGTGVTSLGLDLWNYGGGFDGQVDVITVEGTAGNDAITVDGMYATSVTGLSTFIRLRGPEAADELHVNGMDGNDTINASTMKGMKTFLWGAYGDDVLTGSAHADVVSGGFGSDTVQLGGGHDRFLWNPGDGSDAVIEGGTGYDTLTFYGSNDAESFELSANGARLQLTRDVGNVVLDLGDFDGVDLSTAGSSDSVALHDLSGTTIANLHLDLSGAIAPGFGDGAVDSIVFEGTTSDDVLQLVSSSADVTVWGAPTGLIIRGVDPQDQLRIDALDGNDIVDASTMGAIIALTFYGAAGNDVLFGGGAADFLYGGDGDDVLRGFGGIDTLDGGAGNNVIIQD